MRIVFVFIIGMITSAPALAGRVMIPWTAGDTAAEIMPWAVVNAAEMNGWTKNFKNDTIEEHRQTAPTGELEAEVITEGYKRSYTVCASAAWLQRHGASAQSMGPRYY